jgi:hypothetical protein
MDELAAVTVRLEMGFTPADFRQRLPAISLVNYDEARMQFDHVEGNRKWSLRLVEPRQRTIGSLRLPAVDVELTFKGYLPADVDEFMACFRTHFHRGGG